ncbi:MAG: GNAT family N-acetyltransferase, partial [Clostridiales bacterium]|nr:GNAT family N-acetyltransferase [Clostridiales bacterium]
YADCAYEEIREILEDGKLSYIAVENGHLIGLAGAMPQYGVTGWELHPLAVSSEFRGRGIGTALVAALEEAAAQKGCITMFLGTDDEFGKTSLSNTDLYTDTFEKIKSIRNLRGHPFSFYQRIGYKIVGVIPDANGIGKPDIWMAKRIGS